jgi:DMSO reductase anchor subunit
MLYTIIAFFALAAILGMILLSYILRGKETPKGMALTHGPLAAIGLILLLVYTFNHRPGPVESTVLLVIAAIGGIIVFARDITNKPVPKWLAIVHGLVAVAGFLFLLLYSFA